MNCTLKVENVLTPGEYADIDRFCSAFNSAGELINLACFLKKRFGLEPNLDPDIISGFVTDSSNLPGQAAAVCRPASERECAVIFRTCFQAGIPFTISGGKSNLTGSATPEGGVVVSMVKMLTPVVTVDPAEKTVVAPVGLILEDLRKQILALSNQRLIYPVDPTSRSDAMVGGTIACNASGFTPGAAGATRPWVTALSLLLPNGLIIRAARGQYRSANGRFYLDHEGSVIEWPVPAYLRPQIKNAGGPFSAADGIMDFVDLVVGSEGIFGMVTDCQLKLLDRPKAYLDLFFSLPTEDQAVRFYSFLRTHLAGNFAGLSAFEYFGVHCRAYMKHREILFSGDHQVGIYLQVPLASQSIEDAAEEWLSLITSAACGVDDNRILLLDNERVRALFMEARHSLPANALEVVQRRKTFTIMTDTVVPPERFQEFLNFTHQQLADKGLDYLSFGHLGDCHLHFTLLPAREQVEDGLRLYDQIIARSAELGGVYSGEHGTGKRKRQDFLRCYGPAAVAELKQCKRAVDPHFLLNRGNVVEAD